MLIFICLTIKPLYSWRYAGGFPIIKVTVLELVGRTKAKDIGGSYLVFLTIITSLVTFNIAGLGPYVFSLTRHLLINFSLALVIWISTLISSLTFDLGGFLAHLQPIGRPTFLNPFLCCIELVRLLVRPLTLCVRLAANLSTGHILIRLLGTGFVAGGIFNIRLITFVGIFYFIFEMAVCVIQAYIFTLLPRLYSDEHPY